MAASFSPSRFFLSFCCSCQYLECYCKSCAADGDFGPGKTVFIVNIPAGGTSLCQPLDLNYNMQFKSVVRRVHDFVLNHALQYKISMRDNILKLCSQIFWSFGAPRFTDFRRYGFFKGGFLDAHPGPFETPPEFMFGPSSDDFCSCSNVGFARCPHCSVAYCFQCFFVNLHRCC